MTNLRPSAPCGRAEARCCVGRGSRAEGIFTVEIFVRLFAFGPRSCLTCLHCSLGLPRTKCHQGALMRHPTPGTLVRGQGFGVETGLVAVLPGVDTLYRRNEASETNLRRALRTEETEETIFRIEGPLAVKSPEMKTARLAWSMLAVTTTTPTWPVEWGL